MLHGSYRSAKCPPGYGLLVLLVTIAVLGSGVSLAQLTPEDIAALRRQGQREGWTFTIGENPATRRPLEQLCGLVVPEDWWVDAPFDPCVGWDDLPDRFDWRDYAPLPPVRDQGPCGSCWAFGTVGPLECNILLRDGVEVDLSEQWLVSCNREGYGCNGGWWVHDYHWWKTDACGGTGAVYESVFPYQAADLPCDCPYIHSFLIDGWSFIGDDSSVPSVDALKYAIYHYGPIAVAVYVNSAFQAYEEGIFNGCGNGTVNHAVVLVGWDDNQGPDGVWFLRNSWGPGWGEGGYMRIPYGCSSVGYAATYVDYGNNRPSLTFEYPDGRPELIEPGVENAVRVNVLPDSGTPVPHSGWLHYSTNGGESFFIVELVATGPNQYRAILPPIDCYQRLDWYVSVEEQSGLRIEDPANAPLGHYSAIAATGRSVLFEDDFETDQGWTVYAGADRGNWERADPQQVTSGGVVTQPDDDHTLDGTRCYVTGAPAGGSPGANDLDGGPTILTSPTFDLAGRDGIVSYWRWFHISVEWDDALKVKVSNDGGENWVRVEKIDHRQEWTQAAWRVGDYVVPTDQVRVRFAVNDTEPGSLLEALIDDFKIEVLDCMPPGVCPADLNRDGFVDLSDLSLLLSHYGLTGSATHGEGDIDGDRDVDLGDLSALLAAYGRPCE